MRLLLLVTLLLARSALAEWWNVGQPTGGPVPVNPPKCLEPCDDGPRPSQPQRANTNRSDPQAEARRRAAEEAARREAQRRAEEAEREYQGVRSEQRRLEAVGTSTREQAHRFEDYRERLEARETKVHSLGAVLAPVRPLAVEKPAAGARSPLSMQDYCDRLNAAAAPARSLRASEVPLPSPQVSARTAAFEAPPALPPGRFDEVTASIARARDALKEEAKETSQELAWRFLEARVPFLKSARDSFESVKDNYEALSGLTTRLATNAMLHARAVALTLGGKGGTVTREDDARLLQSMGRDVNDTTSKRLADETRGAIKDSMLDVAEDWFSPGEEP